MTRASALRFFFSQIIHDILHLLSVGKKCMKCWYAYRISKKIDVSRNAVEAIYFFRTYIIYTYTSRFCSSSDCRLSTYKVIDRQWVTHTTSAACYHIELGMIYYYFGWSPNHFRNIITLFSIQAPTYAQNLKLQFKILLCNNVKNIFHVA